MLPVYKIIGAKLKRLFHRRRGLIEDFHKQFYYSKVWADTHWLGNKVLKCPLDLWILQEILFDSKPDIVIETGTFTGGSALFIANVLDSIGNGIVVSIDVEKVGEPPQHNRINYLIGSSLSDEIISRINLFLKPDFKVMAILDSDHKKEHVLKEMEQYGKLVTDNCYMIVEDTNLNGHPVYSGWGSGPGPTEAIRQYLTHHSDFEIDKSKEKYLLTFNSNGYLKKNKST